MSEGKYIENIGCSECGSSDAVGVYQNTETGEYYGICFSCDHKHKNPYNTLEVTEEFEEVKIKDEEEVKSNYNLNSFSINPLISRGISKGTCEKFGVKSIVDSEGNDEAHAYPHYLQDNSIAWCIREVSGKKFKWASSPKSVKFFGQDLAGSNGKMIIVTEGVCDCLAVVEMLGKVGKSYRTVSIVNGASAALKDFKTNFEWINSFENIFLAFDMDEPGQTAAKKVAEMFPPNKVKTISYQGAKDPNELLLSGRHQDFLNAIFSAKETKPDGIVSVEDIFDEAIKPPVMGLSWPWNSLTEVTYGYRRGELYGIGAGCYDAETEYLTETGWKKFNEYSGELVGQYDNGNLTFVKPEKYINEDATEMYEYTTPFGLSMVLSDNHRMVLVDYKGREFVDTVSNIRRQYDSNYRGLTYKIPSSFNLDITDNRIGYSLDYIRLKVAVFADGSFRSDNNSTRCVIHVVKDRKINRLRELLSSCNIDYKESTSCNYGIEFSFYMDNRDKHYPDSWYLSSKDEREAIAEECLLWDGDQTRTYVSNYKKDCDFIQFVFSSLGKKATINSYKSKTNIHWNITFRVCVSNSPFYGLEKKGSKVTDFERVDVKDNRMYCFTVPSGKLIVRRNNRIFISGNSGCGKTEFFKECIHHTINYHRLKAGVIFLEEPATKTLKVLAGKKVNKRFHIPADKGGNWTVEELVDGINDLKGKVYLYNHFGAKDWESIKLKIRFMVSALDIKDIYLDHLTALVAQEDNEYKALNKLMEEMSSLCQELDCTIFYVSHLRKASGTPHEEGGRVTADQFKGSGAIVFWSNFLIGLERNQQAEDEEERNTTTLRVLKDRNTGLATGTTFKLRYDHNTGRWGEIDEDEFQEGF